MRFKSVASVTLFVLLHLFTPLKAYTPADNFTVSCGTTGKSFDGERTWTGDTDSMFLSNQDGSVSANATTQSPSTNQVPYTTARLSRSPFSYSFPVVTGGPKFVRLFFYPASYPSFPHSDASFTVQSNQFTLLKGFNTSLNAQDTKTIFREYVVNVDDGERLNLSFTPSQPNSYAFINGIEVFSMPSDLYYTSAKDVGFKLVGKDTTYSVITNFALQTEYRIKVGGQGISPRNDTGLFRNWAGHDEDYLIKQNPHSNNLSGDSDANMNITVNPDYVAPKELYRTARDMGLNGTLNKSLNLTWEFPVDYGFYYMLRLHFCELDPNINNIRDRVFLIYIASELAEDNADVMKWSQKQKGVAVQKTYAVYTPWNGGTQEKVNVSLQMYPYESANETKFSEPFLNGLEIFKIIPEVNTVSYPRMVSVPEGKSSGQTGTMCLVVAMVSGVGFIFCFIFLWKTSKCVLLSFLTTKSINTQNSWQPSNIYRRFSLVEIKAATNNFDAASIIGVGGFGHVYKGYIDGSTPVAIKRLKPDSQQGAREFKNEIEMLLPLRHLHVAALVGYCNDNQEMIIVYDFMARGNLRDHLYNTDNPPLWWKQRLQICIGASRGLRQLHTGVADTIIHCDVKTTNILLDDKWVAKVSDFGLSSIGPKGMSEAHISTLVKGSFGYLDPENYTRCRFTEKCDVYSFGVVMFEILCARPPLIHTAEMQQVSLANWARLCFESGTLAQIVDPTLKGRIAPECFTKFWEIGVSCLLQDGTLRPSMDDVVSELEFALQLQESAEYCENAGIVSLPSEIVN